MAPLQSQTLLQVIALAVANHLYFRNFEPKNPVTVAVFLAVEPAVFLFAVPGVGPITVLSVSIVYSVFLLSLGLSIALYRLSPLHPLAKFPGPALNKVTQLWSIWIQRGGHYHQYNKALHDKYGPIVRVGPNELSAIDVDVVLTILGPGGLPKGRYYDARQDPRAPGNLLVLRGQSHTERRRLWSRAFTNESVGEYQDALDKRSVLLVDRLAEEASGQVDLSYWINLFSLDFMGDMVFGGGFDLLGTGGDPEGYRTMFEKFIVSVSMLCHVPWAVQTMQRLPILSKNILKLRKFAIDRGTGRAKSGSKTKDLWYHLSDEAGVEKTPPPVSNVVADGALAMIAGSDTTATGLSNLFYLLLSHPKCLAKAQAEVDEVYPKGEIALDPSKHSKLLYLTACLNETLRLLPPTLSSGPRQIPYGSGGRVLGGHFIPEGTQIYVPPYSIHRNPRHFAPMTEEYVPERWLPGGISKDQTLNMSAFIPFSYGPANCVGRPLARREMITVAAAVLQRFDMRFADNYDPHSYLEDLRDHFVTRSGKLPVNLTPRF